MNSIKYRIRFLALLALLAVLIGLRGPAPVFAQAGDYNLDWWTVDGGGAAPASGTGYSLGGSLGQPDAAVWSSGRYTLAGGFWHAASEVGYENEIYLPLVLRNL